MPGFAMNGHRTAARDRSHCTLARALVLLAMAGGAWPMPVQAWWSGGVFLGGPPMMPYYGAPMLAPPAVVPPPYYYAPQYNAPPSYAPPSYAPPSYAPGPYEPPDDSPGPETAAPAGPLPGGAVPGRTCFAGAHICPLDPPGAPGQRCSCPANGSRVFGHVG